jgi:Ion channel
VSTPATIAVSALGVGLIALAGRDVFDALFHPEGKGTLSRLMMRAVWAAFRRLARKRRSAFAFAGPSALLVVIGSWATLLILGWALIFWPHVHGEFQSAVGVHSGSFVEALHISLVTITTLGFADVIPHVGWLRVMTPLEALLGFGLLSASISWLLLIYPALSRRRSLAYEISLLIEAERNTGVALEQLEPASAERIYAELTSRLVAVERDLVNFPISYYFAELDERFALAALALRLQELAERGARPEMPASARLRAWMLLEALRDFGATTAERFHRSPSGGTTEALTAYAHDHMQQGNPAAPAVRP